MEKCWEALWRKSAGEACHFVAGKPAGPLAGVWAKRLFAFCMVEVWKVGDCNFRCVSWLRY